MPLPDAKVRSRLWERHLEQMVHETEGLAGGDILNIVIAAASRSISRNGPGSPIILDDFLTAIHNWRQSKNDVGKNNADAE